MNHISKIFVAPDGRAYKRHAWELRSVGCSKAALLFGYPFWPVSREKRLLDFLLERGFAVSALELGFGQAVAATKPSLGAARAAAAAFAKELGASGPPLYLIASSFSASVVAPLLGEGLLGEGQGLAAAALVAPVLEFPPPGLEAPRSFLSAECRLPIAPESLSGETGLLSAFREQRGSLLRFHRRDLKRLEEEAASGTAVGALSAFAAKAPLAVFVGEADPFVSERVRTSLEGAGARVFAYPRVRHALAHDRLVDNYFADLGSFLDGASSAGAKA